MRSPKKKTWISKETHSILFRKVQIKRMTHNVKKYIWWSPQYKYCFYVLLKDKMEFLLGSEPLCLYQDVNAINLWLHTWFFNHRTKQPQMYEIFLKPKRALKLDALSCLENEHCSEVGWNCSVYTRPTWRWSAVFTMLTAKEFWGVFFWYVQ